MWRSKLGPFGAGLLGVLVGLLLIHAWSDHQALHIVVNFLNQHGAVIANLPAAGTPAP